MRAFLYIFCILFTLASCQKPKTFVTISGNIENPKDSVLKIVTRGYKKTIFLTKQGDFQDTLLIPRDEVYRVVYNRNSTRAYLKKGMDISLSVDGNDFDKTLRFGKDEAKTNNFLHFKNRKEDELYDDDVFSTLDSLKVEQRFKEIERELVSLFEKSEGINPKVYKNELEKTRSTNNEFRQEYLNILYRRTRLARGKKSPYFENYKTPDGTSISLKDYQGKYVFIDLWATWCGICKQEFPYLDTIKEQFKNKNLEFISISLDNKDKENLWKKTVLEKNMSGTQLIANNAFDSQFILDYKITGVPTYIIIDPEGYIVHADAPRPSEKELKNLLSFLNL